MNASKRYLKNAPDTHTGQAHKAMLDFWLWINKGDGVDGAEVYVPITMGYAAAWKLPQPARSIIARHEVEWMKSSRAQDRYIFRRLPYPNLPY